MHHSAEHETARITNLTKQYSPGWFYRNVWSRFSKNKRETVHAVNDVSFTIRAGEIHVLLGANGAGKSTMMDLIAGLQSPTSGTIDINGSGGVGICPQKNVLWDKLTCEEHVYYFNQLKAEGQRERAQTTRTCSPNAISLIKFLLALRLCQADKEETATCDDAYRRQ
ncbi:unnamed protein product [Aureobasidium mustum]|uniref:ABC transporter domain-containing protein n=1 Tax=Aureobasidium mustum TaxID=2773714 RepID=A0A9N8PDY3_9PEZI|nr:unnamed protein product [Aureobasidium mustum]